MCVNVSIFLLFIRTLSFWTKVSTSDHISKDGNIHRYWVLGIQHFFEGHNRTRNNACVWTLLNIIAIWLYHSISILSLNNSLIFFNFFFYTNNHCTYLFCLEFCWARDTEFKFLYFKFSPVLKIQSVPMYILSKM